MTVGSACAGLCWSARVTAAGSAEFVAPVRLGVHAVATHFAEPHAGEDAVYGLWQVVLLVAPADVEGGHRVGAFSENGPVQLADEMVEQSGTAEVRMHRDESDVPDPVLPEQLWPPAAEVVG